MIKLPSRRAFLSGAAALAGGALLPAGAQEPVINVMTPFGFIPDFLEMMNAVSGGHFRKTGLNVKLLGGTGTASAVQQLLAGQVKFVRNAGIDTIMGGAQGQPVLAIATIYQTGHWYLMSHKDRPITGAEQLRGKTIGIVSVKGTTENYLDLMLARVGIRPAEVRREVVGNNPGAFTFIKQGRIDGFIASGAVYAALKIAREPMEAFNCDKYAAIPSQCYVTTRETTDREPGLLMKFLRAMKSSVEEMLSGNYFAILDRAAKDFDIPGIKNREQLASTFEQAKESWLAFGRQNLMRNDPEQWKSAAEAITAAGMANVTNVERLYTNEFIDRASKA